MRRCTSLTNITDHLADALRQALDAAGLPAPTEVQCEIPRDARHGDYATNAAMALAREARRPPRKIAEAIVSNFPRTPAVDRLEIAGPGFLNVFLSPQWCADGLHAILAAGKSYGTSDAGRGRRVLVEFVSANPTGPLVIVNARAAAVGDALARILRAQGYAVESQYYVNDAGEQVRRFGESVVLVHRGLELGEDHYRGEAVRDIAAELAAEHGASLFEPDAAAAAGTTGAAEQYAHTGLLYDVVTGDNGTCNGSIICTAAVGWDGPTGLGTPCGVGAFGAAVRSPGGCGGTASAGLSAGLRAAENAPEPSVPACRTAPRNGYRCLASYRP